MVTASSPATTRLADPALAAAFRNLEGAICDVKNASIVLDSVSEHAIGDRNGFFQQELRKRAPKMLDGYTVFVMTDDNAHALDYIRHHLGDVARRLHDAYFAAYGEAA